MKSLGLAAALTLACAFAGCSSAAPVGTALPGAGALAPSRASIVIRIPHRRGHAHYISASTESATLSVTPSASCAGCTAAFAINPLLTAMSPNCASAAAGITCAIALNLNPGTYVGALATYDGAAGCATLPAPCHVLSQNQSFAIQIVNGAANSISVTLDGVPASIVSFDVNGAVLVDHGNGRSFGLIGASSQGRLLVYARDIDGNIILGPGAPAFSASAGGGFTVTVSGNALLIAAPSQIVPGIFALNIAAASPACSVPSANCASAGYTIEFQPVVAVANSSNNTVAMYASGRIDDPPLVTIASGLTQPSALAFAANGDLFVANASTVLRYAQPWTGAGVTAGSGFADPSILAVAPNGTLAVADTVNDVVDLYAAPGYTSKIASISTAGSAGAIAFDGSNQLWVGESGFLIRYAPPYTASNVVLKASNGVAEPVSLATDANGDVYDVEAGAAKLLDFAAPFSGAAIQSVNDTGVSTVVQRAGIVGTCGTKDVVFRSAGSLGTVATLPVNDGAAQRCTFDQDANFYDVDSMYKNIAEFTAPAYGFAWNLTETTTSPAALAAYP
jgi:hypothetical protein